MTNRIRTFIVTATTTMSAYGGNTKKKVVKPKVEDILERNDLSCYTAVPNPFRLHLAIKPH